MYKQPLSVSVEYSFQDKHIRCSTISKILCTSFVVSGECTRGFKHLVGNVFVATKRSQSQEQCLHSLAILKCVLVYASCNSAESGCRMLCDSQSQENAVINVYLLICRACAAV